MNGASDGSRGGYAGHGTIRAAMAGTVQTEGAYFRLLPETKAYLQQLTILPSIQYIIAVNTLIRQLKIDGNWALLDRFWVFATEQQQNARVSLVNPTSTNITEVNTPTWTKNSGYTGNGTSSYLNTNFNAFSQGINYTLNNSCFGIYATSVVNSNGANGSYIASASTAIALYLNESNITYSYSNCDTDIFVATPSPSPGLYSQQRTSSTANALFFNGNSIVSGSAAVTVIPNVPNYLFAFNQSGVAGSYCANSYGLSFFGSGNINQLKLYTAIQTFATTIGFNK